MNKISIFQFVLFIVPLLLLYGCYTFQDASTEGLNSAHVEFFPNQAEIINPTLSQAFTERLKNKILSESTLKLRNENPDVTFKGAIIQYNTQPIAASSSETSSLTRLTIGVRVDFIHNLDEKKSWTSTFTQFEDFNSNVNFSAVEQSLVTQINEKLVDEIFKRAFVNW